MVTVDGNKCDGRWLVVLRGDPDTDHIVAGVSHAASQGQLMTLFVVGKPTAQMLTRISMLTRFENVSVEVNLRMGTRHSAVGKLARIRYRRSVLDGYLKRNRIKLIVHEWWDGIAGMDPDKYMRLRARWFTDFPLQLQFAAQVLRIPVVALPHGHAMKELSIGSAHARHVAERHNGRLPFGNRDSFSAYVVAHRTDREFLTQRTELSGKNVAVWGSARFSPQWVASLYETVVPFRTDSSARKVLFFLPKWQNMIDRTATLSLLAALGATPGLELWIREHPRKNESSLSHEEKHRLMGTTYVKFIEPTIDSASLIIGCDVLIEIESSIAIDAVLLGKRVVMPRYLQDSSVTSRLDHTNSVVRTYDLESTTAAVMSNDPVLKTDSEFLVDVAAQQNIDTLAFYDSSLRAIAAGR